jgi:hypothetical protein
MEFKYNDGGREAAGYKGKTGDCVARSVAIASGRPYQEVYDRLAEGNENQRITKRSARQKNASKVNGVKTASYGINVKRKWFKDYMAELGFEWVSTMGIGTGCKVHLRSHELPKGKIIVALSKHYAAVIDGVVNDTYKDDRGGTRCVYGYWKKIESKESKEIRKYALLKRLLNTENIITKVS